MPKEEPFGQVIPCPSCGQSIPITDTLTKEIERRTKEKWEQEFRQKEADLERMTGEIAQREQAVQTEKRQINEQVEERVRAREAQLLTAAQQRAEQQVALEVADLKKANEEQAAKLQEAQQEELKLREAKRQWEARQQELDLEVARRVDAARRETEAQTRAASAAEFRRQLSEKDHQMETLKRTIEDLKRKSEQGSMQVQGDAQEHDLKKVLEAAFPTDTIADVPTGIKGADLIHTVHSPLGQPCGVILWESKNTKAWSQGWIKKLKDDQGQTKADLCILVSQSLPEGIQNFGVKDGVWVSGYAFALPLVGALRYHLIELHRVEQSQVGKGQKMEYLYHYLSGNEFRTRMENIVTAFTGMQQELAKERRAMEQIWSRRGKEIERVITNTAGLYGDLQGIIGASLPAISSLELLEAGAGESQGAGETSARSIT